MLHPVLGSSVQKRHGSVGVDLEKGHKDDRGMEQERLRKVDCSAWTREGFGRLSCILPVLKGTYKKDGDSRAHNDRTRGNGFKVKEGRFRLARRKNSFFL